MGSEFTFLMYLVAPFAMASSSCVSSVKFDNMITGIAFVLGVDFNFSSTSIPFIFGIDVLRTLRMPASKAYDTPIFLITNLGQEDIIQQAFAMGADGYFLKAQLSPQNVVDEIDAFFARLQKTGKSPKSSSS